MPADKSGWLQAHYQTSPPVTSSAWGELFLGTGLAWIGEMVAEWTATRRDEVNAAAAARQVELGTWINTVNQHVGAVNANVQSHGDTILADLDVIHQAILSLQEGGGADPAPIIAALQSVESNLAAHDTRETERVLDAVRAISGGSDPASVQALGRIVDAIIQGLQSRASGANVAEGLGSVAAAVGNLNLALGVHVGFPMQEIADALTGGEELGRAADALAALAKDATYTPAELAIVEQYERGDSPATLAWLRTHGLRTVTTVGQVALGMFGVEIAKQVAEKFPAVAQVAQQFAHSIMSSYMQHLVAITPLSKSIFEGAATGIINVVQADLDGLGEITPQEAPALLPRLIAQAIAFGMAAHIQSIVSENVHGAKALGFHQLAAFLGDFSGFAEISKLSRAAQINAGLGEAMTRRAHLVHRAVLPGGGNAEQMFVEGRISEAKYRTYLAEQGWADDWIQAHLESLFREAGPRDIAAAFEDGPIDTAWARQHLQESGFVEADALRIADGLRVRAQRPFRSDYRDEAVTSYVEGLLPAGTLGEALQRLNLDPESVEWIVGAAEFRRARVAAVAARKELEDSRALGQLTDGDLAASVAALGFDPFAVDNAVFRGAARFSQKVFREEGARIEEEIRGEQRAGVTAVVESHRRGLLTDEQLRTTLEGLGVKAREAAYMVALAAARRVPIPQLPHVVTEARQRQLVAEELAAGVEALQLAGVLSQAESAALMEQGGIAPALAAARAVAVARRRQARERTAAEGAAEEQAAEARRAQTRAAVERFRAGLTSAFSLRGELLAAGVTPAVADATVRAEEARRAGDVARDAAAEAARRAAEERRAEEQAAVEAFRAGRIDAAGLFSILVAAGVPPGVAGAIVEREVDRRARAAAPGSA